MVLGKQYVFQQNFAQIVMATFLGHDEATIRYSAGVAVDMVYAADPAKLYNAFKKKNLAAEARVMTRDWGFLPQDWPVK